MQFFVNNLHEKSILESQAEEILTAHAICNFNPCYNFHSCEMKNALIFSQSKAHNVYIYIALSVVDVFDFLSFWSYVSFISWEIIL